jgi:hypothetical protein
MAFPAGMQTLVIKMACAVTASPTLANGLAREKAVSVTRIANSFPVFLQSG